MLCFLRLVGSLAGLTLVSLATGACATSGGAAEQQGQDLIGGEVVEPDAYPATVVFMGGCTAARVGPRHLLTAAHCVLNFDVVDEPHPSKADVVNPSFRPTGHISFTNAAVLADSPRWIEADVLDTHVDDHFLEACVDLGLGGCLSTQLEQTHDFADVALVETIAEIPAEVAIAPIDLEPVLPGDAVVVTGYGCEDGVDAHPLGAPADAVRRLRSGRSIVLPASSIVHAGSPFAAGSVAFDRAMASSVITQGPALDPTAPGLCPGDSGGPLYRGGSRRVIVGVNHSYTFRPASVDPVGLPVTNLHTRVDEDSRFQIGAWLEGFGAATTRTRM
jgi:hypothetical protein